MDVESPKDMASLPSLHEAEDRERDRQQEHRPPAEDQRVSEEKEDHSRHPEEDDPDVEERHEVIDPGHELRKHTRLSPRRMSPKAFQHPARPTRALAEEALEALGHDGEAERDRLVLHQPPRPQQ